MVDWVISIVGVGLFIGLTAYDTSRDQGLFLQAANEVTVARWPFGALKPTWTS